MLPGPLKVTLPSDRSMKAAHTRFNPKPSDLVEYKTMDDLLWGEWNIRLTNQG